MERRQRHSGSGNNTLNQKIDTLNNSINDLVDVLEKLSSKTENRGGSGGYNNPFIRPGSRRRGSQRDIDREFYYEWSQYYKAPKRNKKWADMSNRERMEYNEKKNARKQEAQEYVRRSNERENLYREMRSSRFGSTAVGRYAQSVMERSQRIEDYGMMGKYMQTNAEKIGKGLFGSGKAGAYASKAIGTFGKSIGGLSKILGGPFTTGIVLAVDAVKLFAKVLGAANAYVARLVNFQTDLNEMSFQKSIDISNLINERQVEAAKYIGDLNLKQIEIESQNFLQAIDILTKQFVKATEIAVGPLTKGINETAYDAASSYLDYQAEQEKFALERQMRQGQLTRFQERRDIEYGNFRNVSSRKEENIEAKFNYNSLLKTYETALEAYTDITGTLADPLIKDSEIEKEAQKPIVLPNGKRSTSAADVVSNNQDIIDKLSEIKITRLDKALGIGQGELAKTLLKNLSQPELFKAESVEVVSQQISNLTNTIANIQEQVGNKQIEIATEAAKKYIDASLEAKKMWLQLSQKTEQWLDKFDEVTNNLGVSLGYTNRKQLDTFQTSMFEASKVAAKFGKSFEDVTRMQQTFVETSGRNKIMGQHDYGQLLGLGKYLGDNDLAANYASEMEIFNTGVSDSVDMLDEALQDVNKMGLNGRKYTKTLVDNLKLAQKYQFKEGTKSLMNMAKWAENTRFNLGALGGMLDKVREGGLENVITMGAQFQVLGGHAAMNADPLAMMYESYADPEAYAKRMQDMTKGYGQIDKKTGETKFSGNEVMMMQQLAKVQGRSLEDVQNEVRARNKREVVARQLSGDFDEDQQAFISNNATYNKETGRFEVKVKRGNEYVDTDVNQLTKDDLENLMPEKHNERMEDYMSTVIDYLAKMTGEENLQKTMLGEKLNEPRKEAYDERLKIAHENFTKEFETYVTNAKEGMKLANEKFKDYINMWQNNTDAQGPGLDQINAATSNIASALDNTAEIISNSNQMILDSIARAKFGSSNVSGKDETEGWMNTATMTGKIPISTPQTTEDGIITNSNKPMVTQASNVTKINDGLVKSDPKDVAIFAKEGGVIGNFLDNLYSDVHSSMGGNSMHFDTIKVEMSGSLDLSSGGQSVDIINEIQNNPILLRSLSRMLAQQISASMNGGRGVPNLGIGSI